MLRGHIARAVLLTSLLVPSLAFAQSADPKVVAAQTLFDDARALMKEKRFAEACKKLEASQKLDPGAGTLLNLATCYDQNGQTASAWITYKDAAVAAAARHPDWVAEAKEQAATLEQKLSRLTIAVSGSTPGIVITRDGVNVEPSTYGVALPVDPGPHTIEATAPGHASFKTTIDVGALKDEKSVTVPPLVALGKPAPTQTIVGAVVTGVGGVGLVLGTVFGVVALGKKSDASQLCASDFTVCSPSGKALVDDAKSAGTLSTVFLVAGGVLAVGGVVLLLTAPHAKESGPTVQASLGAPGSTLGVSLGGTF